MSVQLQPLLVYPVYRRSPMSNFTDSIISCMANPALRDQNASVKPEINSQPLGNCKNPLPVGNIRNFFLFMFLPPNVFAYLVLHSKQSYSHGIHASINAILSTVFQVAQLTTHHYETGELLCLRYCAELFTVSLLKLFQYLQRDH
jgi:hypothetical protein